MVNVESTFNYDEYDIQTLENAIKSCKREISSRKYKIKRFTKALNNPRGYSRIKLNNYSSEIKSSRAVIEVMEKEINDCLNEIKRKSSN
jgi:hypothetical protein